MKYGISPARWDENVLCIDKVRHVGDKVAAVVCIDEETCYKALKAIKVDYEVLPAVLDYRTAADEGQPQIHDEYPRNINTEIHHKFGDIEKAFAEADLYAQMCLKGKGLINVLSNLILLSLFGKMEN